jgi:Bacterial archaeo-eukaryotic release factor family 2
MKTDGIAKLLDDPGPFASVYVDVSRDMEDGNRVVELAVRSACDELLQQGASSSVCDQIGSRLAASVHAEAPVSRAVVATERGVLLDEVTRARTVHATATWAPFPDLGAWIADEDTRVPFILALVDHEGGQVSVYRSSLRSADVTESVGSPDVHEHKFHGGGWSHLRYQHNTENVWMRNATEVAAEIERHADSDVDIIMLAGDPQSRSQVVAALGDVRLELVQLESGGRAADGGDEVLFEEINDVLTRHVTASKLADAHALRDRLGKGEAVAIGIADVVDALVRGQVDRLLIDVDRSHDFTVEPARHPGLSFAAVTDLPESIRADLALIAAAALTAADVDATRARTMGGAPVAALLRWHQAAEGTRA